MAPAIWYAAYQLVQQKQPRKLLIVLTDGAPDDEASTRDVIERCQQSGFELLGVGIQTDHVGQFFSMSLVINEPSELKQELFSIFKRRLLIA